MDGAGRLGQRLSDRVVEHERRARRLERELPAVVDHRGRDVVAVERRAGNALAEIAQQEPRAAAQVDDHRTCWQARPDLSAEERPEGRLESLPVGRDHPLQELLVR